MKSKSDHFMRLGEKNSRLILLSTLQRKDVKKLEKNAFALYSHDVSKQ